MVQRHLKSNPKKMKHKTNIRIKGTVKSSESSGSSSSASLLSTERLEGLEVGSSEDCVLTSTLPNSKSPLPHTVRMQ